MERKEVLKLLREVKEKYGEITEELMKEMAASLGLKHFGEIYGISTFYEFLSPLPQGKYIIRVCKNPPCWFKGGEEIVKVIKETLGINPGETTPDKKFTLELTNCIGGCDTPPCMLINHRRFSSLTPEKVRKILKEYQNA